MMNKTDNGSEVWVNVVVEEFTDDFGRHIRKTMWQKLNQPVSLGSIKNPQHTDIIGFKVVENQNIDVRGFFGGK